MDSGILKEKLLTAASAERAAGSIDTAALLETLVDQIDASSKVFGRTLASEAWESIIAGHLSFERDWRSSEAITGAEGAVRKIFAEHPES